ncbi:MAG: hypothetical protein A2167_07700 [Planctomycetes bacterium RBG_13_46_10]|nr:MAG: hypothetical protein A2167_07700 [Planctomycetes bacterium RBG_13_46_10]
MKNLGSREAGSHSRKAGSLLILNLKKTWAHIFNDGISLACVMPIKQSFLCSAKEDFIFPLEAI